MLHMGFEPAITHQNDNDTIEIGTIGVKRKVVPVLN
jgi:hypothetical protein